MSTKVYSDEHGNDLADPTDDLVAFIPEAAKPWPEDDDYHRLPNAYYGLCRGCGQWYHIDEVHMTGGFGCRREELRR